MAEHSAAYDAFLASMNIGYDQWRDGVGYDLEALKRVTQAERIEIVQFMSERLKTHPDWREVEVLGAIGTPAARAILRAAVKRVDRETRLHIEEELAHLEEPSNLEDAIIDALHRTTMSSGLSRAIDMAAENPTPRVREALLDVALNGADDAGRVNCAALALYLGGAAAEPFDWNHRPFFLRFGEEDRSARLKAYRELCARLGVEPRGS